MALVLVGIEGRAGEIASLGTTREDVSLVEFLVFVIAGALRVHSGNLSRFVGEIAHDVAAVDGPRGAKVASAGQSRGMEE